MLNEHLGNDPELVEYIRQRTDIYKNHENTYEIMEELKECKTLGEVTK